MKQHPKALGWITEDNPGSDLGITGWIKSVCAKSGWITAEIILMDGLGKICIDEI
jgi:hypothetical protein